MSNLEELGRLRSQLEELLGLLEDEQADPAALVRAMRSCSLVFEALKAGFPSLEQLEGEERERLSAELERTLRLNAVALSRAGAAGEQLVAGISRSKETRRHVGSLASRDAAGRACDLSA